MFFKIVSFNSGTAEVLFWTDKFQEGLKYSVDIPVVDGKFLSGDELTNHIMSFAPFGQIERLVSVKNATIDDPLLVTQSTKETDQIKDPILDADVEDAKKFAIANIDLTANKIISVLVPPGKITTYSLKKEQALNFKSQGFSGEVPTLIFVEADALGVEPKQVAEDILNRSCVVEGYVAEVERYRIPGKAKIRAAKTVEEVDSLLREVNISLQAIKAA